MFIYTFGAYVYTSVCMLTQNSELAYSKLTGLGHTVKNELPCSECKRHRLAQQRIAAEPVCLSCVCCSHWTELLRTPRTSQQQWPTPHISAQKCIQGFQSNVGEKNQHSFWTFRDLWCQKITIILVSLRSLNNYVESKNTVMPIWHSFSHIICDKTQFYYCNHQLILLYDTNSKWRTLQLTSNTHPFNGPFPGIRRSAGTRKVKPIWILLEQETVSGSGISWAVCKSAPRSRQITTLAPHHSVSYRPDALPAAQPTASKHWRQVHWP